MTWRNDAHGLTLKIPEAKLFLPAHTYAMKLSQLPRQAGTIRIITYKFADLEYVINLLSKRAHDIQIIVNSKFRRDAAMVADQLPGIEIRIHPRLHDKVVLIEPRTVYVGSANFGRNDWSESTVGLRSKEAFDWFVKERWAPLWSESERIQETSDSPMTIVSDGKGPAPGYVRIAG